MIIKESFHAYRCFLESGQVVGKMVRQKLSDLDQGEVVIAAKYSSINYKDALGATGKGRIFKKMPIIGGIDVAGIVAQSSDARFKVGDEVLVTGCGLGESHDGGYSEVVRVPADWVVKKPANLSLFETMIYGTAGFTAAIAVHRMLVNDQTPDQGPIVVTGATGGVGTMAISMLSQLGFEVWAVTGKPEMASYLKNLGARQIKTVAELELGKRPLESVKFGGVVDNVGGAVLEGVLRHVNLWGNVASIGLAMGAEFSATVMPHILRGVSILGISSANCPMPLRQKLWQRLATDLKPGRLSEMVSETVSLTEMPSRFEAMLDRKTHGRIVVSCEGTT